MVHDAPSTCAYASRRIVAGTLGIDPPDGAQRSSLKIATTAAAAMGTTRLLIASDYAMTRDAMRALLQTKSRHFLFVAEANSVADAPLEFRGVTADVILLEVSAPGAGALRAVGSIIAECPQARIVILTNITDSAFVRSMLATGVVGYILKHSSTDQLILAIRRAAANKRFLDSHLIDVAWVEALPKRKSAKLPHLSRREREVLAGIARGFSNRQLATELKLSTKTVETYRGRLYQKLNLHNRAELVNYAIAFGLWSPS